VTTSHVSRKGNGVSKASSGQGLASCRHSPRVVGRGIASIGSGVCLHPVKIGSVGCAADPAVLVAAEGVIDADPTWRHEAIYTRAEAEQLVSDPRLPADRRVLYGLKLLGALRHGEASGLTWATYDTATRPLGAIHLGKTKSRMPRTVPVHPVLARILAAWKLGGWAATYGRPPRAEDLVCPTRAGLRRKPAASQVQFVEDLETIGLRSRAGADRNRRGHDLRRTFITLARADGALDGLLRWVTHGPRPNEMLDVYSSPPWESLCAEVSKLRLELRAGEVVQLPVTAAVGAALVQSEQAIEMSLKKERPQRDSNPRCGLPTWRRITAASHDLRWLDR